MLTDEVLAFLQRHSVARFSTVDNKGQPHVVPVCYVLEEETVYFSIDQKPKQATHRPLKRIRNLIHNPLVALIVDHYEEDWTQLGWVMIQGHAELLTHGNEHTRAQHQLKDRYPQLKKMKINDLPVIAIRIKHIISWGELASG